MRRMTWSKCLPIELWPASDRAAWRKALEPGDVFEPGGVASRWSAATQRKTASGYGRFLCWLEAQGELDQRSVPESRVTRDRADRYLADLQRINNGHTTHCRIQELGDALRALAPAGDWSWLLRAAARLRAKTVPARDKRPRLRPVQELVAEGFRLMEEADGDRQLSELGRAVAYRDGLIIAFLGSHPMRLRNLALSRIGHHLIEQGEQFVLKLSETKGHQAYEAVISGPLAAALQRYLHHHRPVLLKARGRWHAPAGDALWISKDGSACSEETFGNVIRKRTSGSDRLPLSPHLFRSCAATSIAIEAPESVDIIPAILTHGSPRTAERYYNLASSLEASRAYDAFLEERCLELMQESGPHRAATVTVILRGTLAPPDVVPMLLGSYRSSHASRDLRPLQFRPAT